MYFPLVQSVKQTEASIFNLQEHGVGLAERLKYLTKNSGCFSFVAVILWSSPSSAQSRILYESPCEFNAEILLFLFRPLVKRTLKHMLTLCGQQISMQMVLLNYAFAISVITSTFIFLGCSTRFLSAFQTKCRIVLIL